MSAFLRRLLVRVQCFFLHDYGAWGEDLSLEFKSTRYYQYRGCRRCRVVKERMVW